MVKADSVASNSPVVFHINGEKHSVDAGSKVDARTVLADYIRDVANLKGTKVMCREGGCGACTVTARVIDPATGSEVVKSVNSCLTPVLSCDGWDISTVESLGNKHEGYHVIQNRLVNFHGTQCGYCSPGMIMSAYSLLEAKKEIEMEDVEKNLDGNICRCTGYRPILDAFKSLAKDASSDLKQKCSDIEDCATCPIKQANGNGVCGGKARAVTQNSLKLSSGEEWVTASSLEGALSAAAQCNNNATGYRFVAGNTSTGIYKNEGPFQTFIDINGIPELKKTVVDDNGITIGGGATLTEVINLLQDASKTAGLEYGKKIVSHLERVANVSVRNNGTIAGNLMIKHAHQDFPSDVFVILEAIGATLKIASSKSKLFGIGKKIAVEESKPLSMTEFLATDMKGKLILSVHLSKLDGYHYRSFKITRRYQNAHAYVNAGFLLKVNKTDKTIEERPRIVYGGISSSFIHASEAEACLQGKSLLEEKTLQDVLQALEKEVKPEGGPLEAAPEYRIKLAKTLLYKTILEIVGEKGGDKLRSGATDIIRNTTKAQQVYDTNESETNLYKAVPKYEGAIQVSGEAEYTGDIPIQPNELFGVFVQSTVAVADIKDVDASEALKIPGVFRYITAKDVPGENNNMKFNFWPSKTIEPVFATEKVSYHGQALGLILATTKEVAERAAKVVKVTYENIQKPIVKIDEAIEKAKNEGTLVQNTFGTFSTKPAEDIKVAHTVSGTMRFGSQYHFYMETQTVVCHPREDGIDVHCCTQWIDHTQNTIATVLNIPTNSINMQVRRVGGGFGGKISRNTFVATACSVATWVTGRPCRVILDLETNMTMIGKRLPYRIPYEVGFDENGRIGSLKVDLICDTGYSVNDPDSFVALMHIQNVYKSAGWEVVTSYVPTNTAANTACRAPGSIKAVALLEWIMDSIAYTLKKDPIAVRQANFISTGDPLIFGAPTYERVNLIPEMIENMKTESDYEARLAAVEKFNQENRWKKRGMSVVPVRYPIDYFATNLPASVAIYHMDGYVAVSHAGIEMGQGLNTKASVKVLQTVAHALQVPMDRIKIKPTNNFIGCNAFPSGGSIASEIVCYSVMRACEEIRENLRPILEKLENPSWEKLIADAHAAKVKLTATYTPTAKDDIKGYDVWVLNVTEVEIDALTGEYKIIRTDIYEDVGKSMSPGVDIGQIEGGYMMGQGFWTTEKIIHDEETGKLLTSGTWDYKPPECKDVPEDFRITLLRNTPNPHGVLRSKATGEPSVDSAFAVILAMRNAIAAARADIGVTDWFDMECPVSPEDIAQLCLTAESHLTLQ
ncbi:Indole-3-acetaldehyde oxidase [Orchesella cincta]|uniref:Indole-3-acetaldehyde oxidase n=1 Tax=Orchesella cincta TaxID=48709 RepID=A0A1D2NKQ2_ORCCI|nr:Indole-3-acetaldehyde oxidase [Orchesella cincta]